MLVQLLVALPVRLPAQQAHNVVLIVTDGVRWQDVFRGADTSLINNRWGGVDDTAALRSQFVRAQPDSARAALLPFIWGEVARRGRIFGNADQGGTATVTNGLKFSYPGYNEMLSGRADPRIDRNDAGPNPNTTVFEWLNARLEYRGRVGVFGTWDAFPAIFNRERSRLYIRAGWEPPFGAGPLGAGPLGASRALLTRMYATTTRFWHDLAYDAFMQAAVLDYVRTQHPRVLFVGYGETDEWAHARRYDQTLRSLHHVDAFIAELWRTMQAMPQYRDRTTFIITTDHGRGGGLEDWTDHGRDVNGAENIWIAALGPGVVPSHEAAPGPVTQSQVAATVAALLGLDYGAAAPGAAPPITGLGGGRR